MSHVSGFRPAPERRRLDNGTFNGKDKHGTCSVGILLDALSTTLSVTGFGVETRYGRASGTLAPYLDAGWGGVVVVKAGLKPLADLATFLEPFGSLVRRACPGALHYRSAGGPSPQKQRRTWGRAVAGTNGQRLQELLTRTAWDSGAMDQLRVQHMVAQASVGRGVQIIDDTGFAKKGTHSVGVARQYSGTLGRVDNCQVLVTSHYVDRSFDWPIAARLYLPESWVQDEARLEKGKVPGDINFKTKGEIALEIIDTGIAAGLPTWAVLADAGYGDQPSFLEGLETRALPHVVGVASTTRFRLSQEVELDSVRK